MAVFMRWLLFLLLALIFLNPVSVYAQEDASSSSVLSPTPSPKQTVDYVLPYPGLLPDNPLYGIKMIRDRIVLMVISDTLKRSRFNLLQADKRLKAGYMLFYEDREKVDLSLSTISKGQNYFSEAISEGKRAKKEGYDVKELFNDLMNSSLKQEELLEELEEEVQSNKVSEVKNLQRKLDSLQRSIGK